MGAHSTMKQDEYTTLWEAISDADSLDELARKGYDRDLLLVLYTNKVIRDTKSRYYSVKRRVPELLMDWRLGTSLVEIAKDLNFPPVLLTNLILRQHGWTKNRINTAMREPESVGDPRIRDELKRVQSADLIYSTEGNRIQFERGKTVEGYIGKWLAANKKKFITEKEAKERGHPKTPDFHLEAPMKVDGRWVNWIESKGTFGDGKEVNKDYRKQLTHYVDLFGAGMVVYWYGFIGGVLDDEERILVKDKRFFEKDHA